MSHIDKKIVRISANTTTFFDINNKSLFSNILMKIGLMIMLSKYCTDIVISILYQL